MQRRLDRQREELEGFARVLAHDVREPLGAMESLARLIESDIRGGKLDDAVARSQHLALAAARSRALVAALFEFTKAQPSVTFEPIGMTAVLEDALAVMTDLIHRRGAQVTSSVLPAVSGHAPLLMQLLQNLISNAINYCAESRPAVHIAAAPDDRMWSFSVRDNGIGIAEKYQAKIFEPFHRLHSQDKYEGTGLGLATCRKIVERHGGRIWCDSKAGEGSTFYFTLPAIDGAVPASR